MPIPNLHWNCAFCGQDTNLSTDLRVISVSRLCTCGALGLGAPPYDVDEIFDDAVGQFGIADGYLTEYDADSVRGLEAIGVEVSEGRRVTMGAQEFLVLWFRGGDRGQGSELRAFGRIVRLMHEQPNSRRHRRDGDVAGDFDVWFDGGAAKHHTGVSTYSFADGSRATMTTALVWHIGIMLASGRGIRLSAQWTEHDRVAPPR